MTRKILLVIRSLGQGGAERQLVLLAKNLKIRGYNVSVAVLYRQGSYIKELTDAGIPIIDFTKRGRWDFFGVLIRIRNFLKSWNPDIVYSFMPAENVLLLVLKPFVKNLNYILVCGLRVSSSNLTDYGLFAKTLSAGQRFLLPFADLVISNSFRALHEMQAYIPKGRGVVVPNGFEIDKFEADDASGLVCRKEWAVNKDDIVIGLVGRLDPQKNHNVAIEVVARLLPLHKNLKLVFIGNGSADYRASVQAFAEERGVSDILTWAGGTTDMRPAYSALDILCLPSIAEGFPNVLGEAMCAGLPCVAFDVGDCELVLRGGGWVVPAGDVEGFALALDACIKTQKQWDRKKPKEFISKEYSPDLLADRTLNAINAYTTGVSI
jgi:glycosyltransferase involved in cell wall biosynthesis